jgi:GT2 family glycosyltransferase
VTLAAAKTPLVCVVVLNYNGAQHLVYSLPSLAATDYPNVRLLVVDNASNDGSADMVASLCASAVLIRSERNLGWAGGNNLGIRAALGMGADYIVLANNDIRVAAQWLDVAVQVAERDQSVGVVGFNVIEPLDHSGDVLAVFERAKAAWRACETSSPAYVGGMAMFVRAELFERIGFFDEHFFVYGEENDFQIRARKGGYRMVATNVPVWHYGQGWFGRQRTRAAVLQTRNNIQLLIKHGSGGRLLQSARRHVRSRILTKGSMQAQGEAVEQRLRSSSIAFNIGVLLYGAFWNLGHLRSIVRRRKEDNRRAERSRQLLLQEHAKRL